jgi:hypothetical protein
MKGGGVECEKGDRMGDTAGRPYTGRHGGLPLRGRSSSSARMNGGGNKKSMSAFQAVEPAHGLVRALRDFASAPFRLEGMVLIIALRASLTESGV